METERKVSRMFSLEERSRAVELYLTTPMTTAQVVECLGYPTRQCLERWLAMDPRYAGRMAKPIIPLETRRKAIELVLGGMQQKQAAKQLGVSVGAVHNWVRAYRRGGMAEYLTCWGPGLLRLGAIMSFGGYCVSRPGLLRLGAVVG